jgi:ribosome biogenesis ATPase
MSSSPYVLDAKLLHRVGCHVAEVRARGGRATEEGAVQHLLSVHREYSRKPQAAFRKSVGRALRRHQADPAAAPSPLAGGSGRKRARVATSTSSAPGAEGEEDPSEDERVMQQQQQQQQQQPHNLLNQSMRQKYKKAAASKQPAVAKRALGGLLAERPTARYSDLGGIGGVLQEVRELIEYPLTHPEVYEHLGIEPPRGTLLHGPPGCGKTLLANAIAGELGVGFLSISAPEIVSGMSGESEQKVRELFDTAAASAPCVVFIDEVDAITPKRETSSRGMEKRIVAQLLTCMDSLTMERTGGKAVAVIGATNRPNDLDPALRRAGRFDREICLGVPDEAARERILRVMCSKLRLSGDFDFSVVAKRTPGYVGADLNSLTKEAAVLAINRIFPHLQLDQDGEDREEGEGEGHGTAARRRLTEEEMADLFITMEDFLQATRKVQPSAKREGFATAPDVTWADVGALTSIREELSLSVLQPIAFPERFEKLGLSIPAGVLLYGPPGCGKTLLAKAAASESGANFVSVKGPELLDKYVGESEKAVRQVFQRARASAPCIVFFDELDSLCPRRGSSEGGNGGVSERVVNQLLTEMDGLESRKGVFVIAATNRPELIDPAMLRPGRLDKLLFVPLPSPEDRAVILGTLCKRVAVEPGTDIGRIGCDPRAQGYSGADLAALVREAGLDVLREAGGAGAPAADFITAANFERAFARVQPSVSKHDSRVYMGMQRRLRTARGHAEGGADASEPGKGREEAEEGEGAASSPSAKK